MDRRPTARPSAAVSRPRRPGRRGSSSPPAPRSSSPAGTCSARWTEMLSSAIVRIRSFHTRNGLIRTMATRTMNKSDLGAELGSALFRVAKLAKRSVRADLEELGLTMPQAMLLHHLAADGGRRSARELGRECDMLASTATGVIDRLERDGYVRRERDLDDRRVVWVQLTDKGEALQGKLPAF